MTKPMLNNMIILTMKYQLSMNKFALNFNNDIIIGEENAKVERICMILFISGGGAIHGSGLNKYKLRQKETATTTRFSAHRTTFIEMVLSK